MAGQRDGDEDFPGADPWCGWSRTQPVGLGIFQS